MPKTDSKNPAHLRAEAEALSEQAESLRNEAREIERKELEAKPLLNRLVFAATARCECGAGLAYDTSGEVRTDTQARSWMASQWECSDILRFKELPPEDQARVKAATHSSPYPFAFYKIDSETQPSANGLTTRPAQPTPRQEPDHA